MTDPQPSDSTRRRLISIGEGIALAALAISGLGLWNSWRSDHGAPATVAEKSLAIPLALRGKLADDGKRLEIAPVEPGHALESMTLTATGKPPLELGSDPALSASAVEGLLGEVAKKDGIGSLSVTIAARYIEAGRDRRGGGRYRVSYRWEGGGLFGGHSLRLTGLTRG